MRNKYDILIINFHFLHYIQIPILVYKSPSIRMRAVTIFPIIMTLYISIYISISSTFNVVKYYLERSKLIYVIIIYRNSRNNQFMQSGVCLISIFAKWSIGEPLPKESSASSGSVVFITFKVLKCISCLALEWFIKF